MHAPAFARLGEDVADVRAARIEDGVRVLRDPLRWPHGIRQCQMVSKRKIPDIGGDPPQAFDFQLEGIGL
jgi:hypothetical protein